MLTDACPIARRILLLLLLTYALTARTTARAEDVAIVVGIGTYQHLPDARLEGIDRDLSDMDAALRAAGFQTLRLWNAQSSEAGIRAAFAEAARRVHPGDRFVYYQSSHGSRDYHLLTYDTTTSGAHMFSKTDLQHLMEQVATPRKSLVLDACFSGGFTDRSDATGYVRNKFYPIESLKDQEPKGIQDRTDTVVRTLAPVEANGDGRRDFVVFASSQDNQPSQVVQINGVICSAFTHFLVAQLNGAHRSAWNAVVQPTIVAVLRATHNQQNPVFDSTYLAYLIFTTDEHLQGSEAASIPVRNLAQLYDVCNVAPSRLALSAELQGSRPDVNEIYHPETQVRLFLNVGLSGYLFVINRDDSDRAQLVGWDQTELDFNDAEKLVDQSYLSRPDAFEFGKGTLHITTSARNGFENWKAFLFTDRNDALKFARLWINLPTDNKKQVRLTSFVGAKLDTVVRIGVSSEDGSRALYTSEVHYRVADH